MDCYKAEYLQARLPRHNHSFEKIRVLAVAWVTYSHVAPLKAMGSHVFCSINYDPFDQEWNIWHPKHIHAGGRCPTKECIGWNIEIFFDATDGQNEVLDLVTQLDWYLHCPFSNAISEVWIISLYASIPKENVVSLFSSLRQEQIRFNHWYLNRKKSS